MTHKSLLASLTQLENAVWAESYAATIVIESRSTADPMAARQAALIAADAEIERLRAVTFARHVADELAANRSRHVLRPNGCCSCGFRAERPGDTSRDREELMNLHLMHVGALGIANIPETK